MIPTEILVLSVKAVAVIFILTLGIILVVSMKKDGKLTADEASKVVLIALLIYMTVVNGTRSTEWLVFDQGTYLIILGSVLGLAGLDIYKTKGLLNDKEKNSKDC
jgi:hypothetical protein